MDLPEPRIIQLRPFAGALNSEGSATPFVHTYAYVFGDWGVHRHLDNPQHWIITMLPSGMSVPPDFCTFLDPCKAFAAAKAFQRLRNDWHIIRQENLTLELKAKMMDICESNGAIKGLIGMTGKLDHNAFGARRSKRPNGYGPSLD